jgi:hypothetical protein
MKRTAEGVKKRIAESLAFAKDMPKHLEQICWDDEVTIGKKHKNRMLGIHPNKASKDDINKRTTVCLDKGGYIPRKFGVDRNADFGTTSVTFVVSDQDEANGLKAFDEKNIDMLARPNMWPADGDNPPPTRSEVARSHNRILKVGKFKEGTSGPRWPSKVRLGVPCDAKGEPESFVRIVDSEKKVVPLDALPGKKWKRLIFEIHYDYFKPGGMETGAIKKLKYVLLDKDQSSNESPEDYDQLDEDLSYLDAPDTAAKPEENPPANPEETNEAAPNQDDIAELLGEADGVPKKKKARKTA